MIEVALFLVVLLLELWAGYTVEVMQYFLCPFAAVSEQVTYEPLWILTFKLFFLCKLSIASFLVVVFGREIKTFEQYWARWCFMWIIIPEILFDFIQETTGDNTILEKYELHILAFSLIATSFEANRRWNKKTLTT